MDITKVLEIPLGEIKLQGSNVRSDLDSPNSQENLQELAQNIRVNGLLQPIVLRGEFGKPPYDVIVGQRRFLAHQVLGAESIRATFSGEIDNMNALLLSLSENMCRQEMNYEDTQRAITTLYNHFDKDERRVQAQTGFSIRMIRNYVRIEEQATDKIKDLLKNGLSMADAKRAIDASQGDKTKADALIDEIMKLTAYEKKRLVESSNKNPKASVGDLVKEAKKPKWEETIILNLPTEISDAVKKATETLSIDAEQLAMDVLVSWLKTNDFLLEANG
jgi:ParB family chromosome partitioning protein